MKNLRKVTVLSLAALLLAGGAVAQVDLSRFVALGDSLTAGVVNFGSVERFQLLSIPNLIATQAGYGSSFAQPLVSEPGLPPLLEVKALNVTALGISPTIGLKDGFGQPLNPTHDGPYNNLAIDGANTGDLLTLTGNIFNLQEDMLKYAGGLVGKKVPFADLVLRDGQTTPIQQAIGAQGTFYWVLIGHNDVLGAITTAVFLPGVTVTPIETFQQNFQMVLGALRQNRPNATILVGNILDVSRAPYATTINPYIVNPADGSHIPLIGEAGLLTESDRVSLGASALLAQGIGIPVAAGGTGQPLPEGGLDSQNQFQAGVVLRASEIAQMQQYIAAMNATIESVAAAVGAQVMDMNTLYDDLVDNGRIIGGIHVDMGFLTGGLVSLDGIHGSGLGYAVIANEVIDFMNATYGTNMAPVNLRPILLGESSATSVTAANFVFSTEAAVRLVNAYAPGVRTDKLEAAARQPRSRQRSTPTDRSDKPGIRTPR